MDHSLSRRGPRPTRSRTCWRTVLSTTCLLATSALAPGATLEVDDSGGTPYQTIAAAVAASNPGDTIFVRAGTYHETVTPPNDATANACITFQGERGANGEYLAVIDPSEPVSVTWTYDATYKCYKTATSNFGSGYVATDSNVNTRKKNNGPAVLTYNGQFIARIGGVAMDDSAHGLPVLGYPRDQKVSNYHGTNLACEVKFWDLPYAAYGTAGVDSASTTYVRFRDDQDPNTLDLRVSRRNTYGFNLTDRSYITVRDFAVRGTTVAVYLTNTLGVPNSSCSYNVIENNDLRHGTERVVLKNPGCSFNVIRGNHTTLDNYGYQGMGANDKGWSLNAPYDLGLKSFFYLFYKLSVSDTGSTADTNIELSNVGDGNEICDNVIHTGGQGIAVGGTATTSATKIHNNDIYGFSSAGLLLGIVSPTTATCKLEVYDNRVRDCQFTARVHDVGQGSGTRTMYFYRNRLWNPRDLGSLLFFSYSNSATSQNAANCHFYVYHNSFGGCYSATKFTSDAATYGGLPNAYFVNNVSSNGTLINAATSLFNGSASLIGGWDYNWHNTGQATTWFGTNNEVQTGNKVWGPDSEPTWLLPASGAGSTARGNGVDLSQSTITITRGAGNVNISGPLPGMTSGYFTGSAPDMGAVQSSSVLQGMKHRVKLRFDNVGDDTEDLADFPVLVKLDSSRVNYSDIRSDYADIRFTDSDGVTLLDYEVEKWNSAGDSFVWVRVPRVDRQSNDDCIYLYYGKSTLATDGQNKNGVWNASYKGVWHLKESGINSTNYRYDSTANANNAIPNSLGDAGELATGKIGDGNLLERAGNERFTVNYASSLALPNATTVEAWIKPVATGTAPLFAKYTSGTSGFRLHYTSDKVQWQLAPSTGTQVETPGTIGTTNWTHVAATIDADEKMVLYVNGAPVVTGTASAALADSATVMTLGGLGGNNFDGTLDEMRVSNTARSGAWIAAQYASMSDSFITYEPAELLDFDYRIRIALPITDSSSDLVDVPVLVRLNTTRMNYSHAQSNGSDIRFTAADGITPVTCKIDKWNASGESLIWVKVPAIDRGGRTHVYMYYGSATTGLPGQSSSSAIWDSNHKGVWHLDEGGTSTRYDATTHATPAAPQNYDGTESVAARIDVGDELEGSTSAERLKVLASQSNLQISDAVTVEGWIKADSTMTASGVLISKYVNDTSGYRLVYDKTTNKINWEIHGSSDRSTVSSSTVSVGTWYYIVAAIADDETMTLHVSDGQSMLRVAGAGRPLVNSTADLYLGGAASYNFKGIIDEMRVSNAVRSEAWIQAQYRSMNDTLAIYGAEEVP